MEVFLGNLEENSSDLLFADHHIHTRGSDECLEPHEVFELAQKYHLSTIGIADHEVIKSARRIGRYLKR